MKYITARKILAKYILSEVEYTIKFSYSPIFSSFETFLHLSDTEPWYWIIYVSCVLCVMCVCMYVCMYVCMGLHIYAFVGTTNSEFSASYSQTKNKPMLSNGWINSRESSGQSLQQYEQRRVFY
jgi:hypothetical protein